MEAGCSSVADELEHIEVGGGGGGDIPQVFKPEVTRRWRKGAKRILVFTMHNNVMSMKKK